MDVFGWVVLIVGVILIARAIKKKDSEDLKQAKDDKGNDKKNNEITSDVFLVNVQRYGSEIKNEVECAREKHKEELEKKYADDLKLKNTLSEFAKKQGLDGAIIAIWNEIEHYPAWSKRDDFNKYNLLELANVKEISNKEDRSIFFLWKESEYEIKYHESSSFCGDDPYADFTLVEQGDEKFKINTSKHYDEYGSSYYCFAIDGFKRSGNWCKFLLDSWKKIQLKKVENEIDFKYFGAEKIKKNFEE